MVRDKALIINLPGQPKAIAQTLEGLPKHKPAVHGIFAAVPYCLDLIGAPYIETDPAVCQAFRPKKKGNDETAALINRFPDVAGQVDALVQWMCNAAQEGASAHVVERGLFDKLLALGATLFQGLLTIVGPGDFGELSASKTAVWCGAPRSNINAGC